MLARRRTDMKKIGLALIGVAAAATAALALPTAANAVAGKIGYLNDSGYHYIDNPNAGSCYTIGNDVARVHNKTGHHVVVYAGHDCSGDDVIATLHSGEDTETPSVVSLRVDGHDG
jgi:hypothetical protein